MRIVLIFYLTIFTWTTTLSQETYFTVIGEITDAQTKEPLGYANVTIIGKAIGTTSNGNGGFEFHIPTNYSKDTLAISFIGYKTYKISLSDLKNPTELKVRLEQSTFELGEVVVSDKPYTVYSLLDDVISNYEKNYGTRPYEMDGFYREIRQTNKKYGYLIEAACRIYKEDYKTPYNVSLEKIRSNASAKEFSVRTDENFLETILVNDYVSNPVMGFFKRYNKKDKYVIEDTTSMDNHFVYVVSKGNLPYEKETLYINAKDLAILRYDIENKYGPDGNNQPKRKIGKNLIGRYHYLNMVNIFTKINGTYYPSYIRSRFEHDEYNELKKITEKRSVLMRELIINKVNSDSPSKIGSKTEMKSIKLDDQLQKYDAEFWK
ncbi:MAG TPA: carboxypeptidase-like regulatory domain-containing protein, partial [Cyclobacteriaceae bacterium]|nr:carboxypeptidase-like regulatory domain-containing protein [Cyclobacteriaceae bacterium]